VISCRSLDLSQCVIVSEPSFFPDPAQADQPYVLPPPLDILIEPIE
jgi:hypothetical protein